MNLYENWYANIFGFILSESEIFFLLAFFSFSKLYNYFMYEEVKTNFDFHLFDCNFYHEDY